MGGWQFNPWQLNPLAPGFAQQNNDMPVGQQADDASLQASFDQQLNQLRRSSSGGSGGGLRSTDLGASQPVLSLPDLPDNLITGARHRSEAAAHGPGPGPNSGRQQPEFAVNKEVRVGAKRDRSGPFPEDKELVSTFKKAALEVNTHERTAKRLVDDLHHLSRWLRQENRGPIFDRFSRDSPSHASFVADVQDYLRDGGRIAVVAQLNKVAPGSLPSRGNLIGDLHAGDVTLLERFREGAEQRKSATKGAINNILSGFRLFARWLQENNKGPLASQLQGGSLDKEISAYRALGRDPQNRLKSALHDLRRYLPGAEEAEGPEPRGIGRPRHLAPHPEDAPLIDGALGQALTDLRAPTAEQRQFAQKRATRLRGLSDWLQQNGKGSIAGRLNGSKQEQLRLENDVVAFKQAGSRVGFSDLSHLRNYLKLVEANGELGLQAREQSALLLDAGRPSPPQALPATPAASEGAGASLNEAMQEPASPSTARARSDTFGGLQSFVDLNAPTPSDLRDDAHFAPAPSAGARSDTFGGLQSFVDLNAPTPSDLRDDAHFAPAPSAGARSDTFGGLQSFVDLNAPTPDDLRDDAHFAPAPSAGARSDTFGGLQSFVDLNAPTPSDLRDDAHFAPVPSVRARSDTFGGLQSFVDLNAPTPSDLRDDAHFAPVPSAGARSDTFGGLQSFVDLNAPTPDDLRDDAHSAPVRPRGQMLGDTEWQTTMQGTGSAAVLRPGGPDDVQLIHRGRLSPMSEATPATPARAPQPAWPVTARLPDTYRGLPVVDVTTPTASSSDAQIGALDPTASPNVPNGSVLGAIEWLSDAHIQRDYDFLEEQLRGINPTLAARTRLVDPSVSHLLRQMELQDAQSTLQSIYNHNDAPADFLFLPVNNGTPTSPGTHWSLLLVDRRNPERRVAYHYDSLQREGFNDVPAKQLAGLLDATLAPARMARQPNKHDCGVFVVDGTRALVQRLVDGERPDHEPLHLDNLVADRQALQNRLTRRLDRDSGNGTLRQSSFAETGSLRED
ncbi:Ulp1 family isopeptidase [Allomesorhizobium camelthorni]|nr:Ulp1 family isopeptidase [Mesorhizobium camelthorni]